MIFTDIEYPKLYVLKFVPDSKISAGDPGFRLKSCCVHTLAPVQGLPLRISNPMPLPNRAVYTLWRRFRICVCESQTPVPRLKSCCVHTFAPVQGLFVSASDNVPRLKSCCVRTLAPVQGLPLRASSPVPGLKPCCAHTFGRFMVCLCDPQTLYLVSNRAV